MPSGFDSPWPRIAVGTATYGENAPHRAVPAAPRITVATPNDRGRVVGTLIAAFASEPTIRWLFPDDDSYPVYAATYFGHLFDRRVHRGSVWIADGGRAAALWEPPAKDGTPAADGLAALLPAAVMARVRALDGALRPLMPAQPYWYLGLLGTDPAHAGRRLGRAVLAASLRGIARSGAPAVLDTGSEANVDLYRRAGWKVTGSITEPLPHWVLRR